MSSTPRRGAWCLATSLILLSVSLFWGLWFDAGIYPSRRAVSLMGIALAAASYHLFNRSGLKATRVSASIRWPFFLLFGLLCAQLVPLPLELMGVLSPHRAALMQAVANVTGSDRWAPISVAPAMTLLELTTALGCVLVFLLVRQLAEDSRRSWLIISPLLVAGLAEAILGLTQAGNPSGPATATGTFLNRNHFAGFLELLLPFAAIGSWAVFSNRRLSVPVRAAGGLLMFAVGLVFLDAIFYTYSRMGLFVVALVLVSSISLTVWPYAKISFLRLATVTSLLVVLSIAVISLAPARLLNRFEHASAEDRISTDFRLGFWRDSVALLADYAITGCGLGAFESVYPRYQRTGTDYRIEYMHNDVLQALVEMGVPAFVIGLLLLGALMKDMNRAIWFGAGSQDRFIASACISSLTGMLLHSVADFNLHIPANAMTLAWVLGFGMSTRHVKGCTYSLCLDLGSKST